MKKKHLNVNQITIVKIDVKENLINNIKGQINTEKRMIFNKQTLQIYYIIMKHGSYIQTRSFLKTDYILFFHLFF